MRGLSEWLRLLDQIEGSSRSRHGRSRKRQVCIRERVETAGNDWNTSDEIPASLTSLLNEVGRVYVPALLANAAALNRGDKIWEADIDGSLWSQQTFGYQGKCLEWIKGEFKVLSQSDQESVNKLLAGTGCEVLLS